MLSPILFTNTLYFYFVTGWLTTLVTRGLNDFIFRKVDIGGAEPMIEVLQRGNIFERKMHPGITFPLESSLVQLAV
jgi:hypothetical protein